MILNIQLNGQNYFNFNNPFELSNLLFACTHTKKKVMKIECTNDKWIQNGYNQPFKIFNLNNIIIQLLNLCNIFFQFLLYFPYVNCLNFPLCKFYCYYFNLNYLYK